MNPIDYSGVLVAMVVTAIVLGALSLMGIETFSGLGLLVGFGAYGVYSLWRKKRQSQP